MTVKITKTLYTFNELPTEEAREKALEWGRLTTDYPFYEENTESLEAFCANFGCELKEYNTGWYGPRYINTTVSNDSFRGVKVEDMDCKAFREKELTGYYLDFELLDAFADEFKKTGDAMHAFEHALTEGLKAINKDIEYVYSDEGVIDNLLAGDFYYFLEDGTYTSDDPSQPYCEVV